MSVDSNSCEHSTIIGNVITVLGFRSCKTSHEAVNTQLNEVFLIVFNQIFKVNRVKSFVHAIGVIGQLESTLVVNLTADSLVDGDVRLLIKGCLTDVTADQRLFLNSR